MTSTTGDIKCGSILGMLRAVTEVGNIETKLTLGGNIDATCYNGKFKSVSFRNKRQSELKTLNKLLDKESSWS